MITTTEALAAFCAECAEYPFVTIDTEFHRERTYYSQLCLMQMAHPGGGPDSAVLIDTLSDDLDLAPVIALFQNNDVVKVFHAARQDLEIFFVESGVFPAPFFDTQVAAMVCGFGEQVGYETLVRKIAQASLDKSSRFTDWTRRPLTRKQQDYALADVTHLRDIYTFLDSKLEAQDRRHWVEEELAILTDPATYTVVPEEAWRRVKTRHSSPKMLAIVRELARYREETAQSRNVPRNRIMKDDAMLEIASSRPESVSDLSKSRLLLREARRGDIADGIVAAVARGIACPPDQRPVPPPAPPRRHGSEGVSELLRVLLKAKASEFGVAQKLIANAAELDEIANEDQPDVPAMRGWRYEVFGNQAQRLKAGKIALSADGDGVKIVPVASNGDVVAD